MAAMYLDPQYGVSATVDKRMEDEVQMFRRILEAVGNEPVDVSSEMDTLYGGSMVRVYFRYSGVYSQVDISPARYGHTLEEMARLCVKQRDDYKRNKERDMLDRAYRGKDPLPYEGKSNPPPQRKSEVTAALESYRESKQQTQQAPVGSYDNPLRVELQKKVDAWLT